MEDARREGQRRSVSYFSVFLRLSRIYEGVSVCRGKMKAQSCCGRLEGGAEGVGVPELTKRKG